MKIFVFCFLCTGLLLEDVQPFVQSINYWYWMDAGLMQCLLLHSLDGADT
jgi:hypothetical protein